MTSAKSTSSPLKPRVTNARRTSLQAEERGTFFSWEAVSFR
jgi:hypothetical protein